LKYGVIGAIVQTLAPSPWTANVSGRTLKKTSNSARRKQKPGGVFLCHNSDDKDAVKQIADALYLEFGTRYFLDAYAIPVGEAFIPWIEKALAGSTGCVIFLGANGWGPTHLWEAERAVARYREQPRFKLIPAALPGIKIKDMKRLGAGTIFQRINWADFTRRLDDHASLAKLHAALTGQSLPQDRGPAHLTPYQIRRDAERWRLSKGLDASILYQGEQLREAERLLRENPDFVVVDEVISFLNAGTVRERTMADGAKFDARATSEFVQASRQMTQWDLEQARQTELQMEIDRRLASGESLEAGQLSSMRIGSLRGELA
jgi:hypothetical protein